MEKLNELVFLLPDYELEGFPRNLTEETAAQVLSGWIALWHPTLMCGAGRIPRWHQASRLPTVLTSILFVLPPISRNVISPSSVDEIAKAGGLVMEPTASWRSFQSQLLAEFPQLDVNALATELAVEFAALGYAFLQVQLMTRQLRYTSNLDVALFEEQVLKATEAALANDIESAKVLLQACFDSLGQERDHYYSNDANLLDITLLAETTLGKSLERQLADPTPTSFIASASILRRLQDKSSQNLDQLKLRLSAGTACIAGGLDTEDAWPLAPRETAVRALYQAPDAYRQLGVEPPSVFARMSYGMGADSASVLSRFGFRGVLLIAFTGGSYPTSAQVKISWESHDGSRIPAIACEPLDAMSANSYLAFGWTLGEALDRQHVPTIVLAHWPGKTSEFLELLQIVAARTPALGHFTLADRYFNETSNPYHHERLEPSAFGYNWLAESEQPAELITSSKQTLTMQCRARSLQNICNLIWQLRNLRVKADWPKDEKGQPVAPSYSPVPISQISPQLATIFDSLDKLMIQPDHPTARFEELQAACTQLSRECMESMQPLLTKRRDANSGSQSSGITGKLMFNPRSNPVRLALPTALNQSIESSESWHFATGPAGAGRLTCIDLPSMGFVIAPFSNNTPTMDRITLADSGGMLRNEFLEAQVDMQRGHIRSLHVPAKRGNRLSVMVAYREKNGAKVEHSEMVAHSVKVLEGSNMQGTVRVEGKLQWRGKSLASFSVDYEVQRGSRILSASITLSNLQFTDERNPWLSAYILRVAWPTDAANLRTFPDGRSTAWRGSKVIAGDLIEIDEADYQTHYLTGGLAFHGRQEMRFLETILAAPGQTSVQHRVGFAVDLPYPLATAHQFLDAPFQCDLTGTKAVASGWLVNVDSKNVHVDLECPLQDEHGRTVGIRVFVSELQGKSTTAEVQFFRDLAEASRVDYAGNKISRVTAKADTLTIAMRAGEQSLVDVLWQN
jgi:alpha-mannosidase